MRRLGLSWVVCGVVLGGAAACGDDGGAVPGDGGSSDGAVDAGRPVGDAGPPMRVLSVRLGGDGEGAVTGADGAIACGDGMTDCNVSAPEGSELTLEASAVGPSLFAGWAGDGIDCTDAGACTVTLDGDVTVIASFDLDDLSLMVTTDGTGSGSVTSDPAGVDCPDGCAASFTAFTEVELTATPDGSSVFTGWTGACEGTGATCTVTLDEAQSVGATFDLREVTLEVELTGDGTGTVTSDVGGIDCGETCSATVAWGTEVTLTATVDSATSVFDGYTGCTTTDESCTITVEGDTAVQVSFQLHRYDLDVTVDGTGNGTVVSGAGGIDCGSDCSETYAHGATVTLTASAETATSELVGWSGACAGETSNVCTVEVTAATSVGATFDLRSRTLNVSKTGGGTGTVTSTPAGVDCGSDCSGDFPHGTTVTLTATPDAATSTFGTWGGACAGEASPTCDVDMTAVRSVTVSFDLAPRELVVTRDGTGSGTVTSSPGGIGCGSTCSATFLHGTDVTLTASPDGGSSFTSWGGACAGETSIFCTVTMDDDHGVTATFD